jgi:uncharacterized protein YggE
MRALLFLLLLTIPILSYSQTGQKNFIDQNYIEIIGKAEMEIVPNIIDLKIIINENDTKGKTSISDLEKSMFDKLTEIGIDLEKDLVVKDLTSNFKFHVILKTDIVLMKEYILTVDKASKAAEVIAQLEKIGISNINIEKLDHSEIDKFRQDVKISAIKAAQTKAKYLANAVNQEIGRALFIEEIDTPLTYNQNSNVMIRGISNIYGSSAKIPNIEFDKIVISSSIGVRFELK